MLPLKRPIRFLSRRDFLKLGEPLSIGLLLSACGINTEISATPMPSPTATTAATPTPGCIDLSSIGRFVPIKGQRYETTVPDTLDLQEHAQLAINALTRCTDPDLDYEVYFYGSPERNPPAMYRLMGPIFCKFWESLSLMRYLTGSTVNSQVDQRWREVFLEMFQNYTVGFSSVDGRLLCWAANNFRQEDNPCWRNVAEEAVERLSGIYTHESDFCYNTNENGDMNTGWEATYEGWVLQGVTSVYAATGYAPARKLADELARYLKDHAQIFDSNGHFLARHESDMGPALHFHHNGNCMTALSEYALATGDPEFAAFAKKGYKYARSVGWPLVGFFPEYIEDWPDPRTYIDCETCCVADMIIMAINLSKLGQGDYWDDVDRYVRNQFIEMQLKNGDWIVQYADNFPDKPVAADEDSTDIAARVVGSFAGWASANDYAANPGENFISGCCTGNGARALFNVWEKMLEFTDGQLRIHLLFNRASQWADINSYIPYQGQVDILIKTSCDVEIRIPEWVKGEELSCVVDGEPRDLLVHNRYADIGYVESGSLVSLSFPISERTEQITIGEVSYTLIIKGNDVVFIDPPGKYQPFYQREKYRGSQTLWVTRERFIPAT